MEPNWSAVERIRERGGVGLVLGNGGYAGTVNRALRDVFAGVSVMSLMGQHQSHDVHLSFLPHDVDLMLTHLRTKQIKTLLFAGDIGLYRMPGLLEAVSKPVNSMAAKMLLSELEKGPGAALRALVGLLRTLEIHCEHLGEVFPVLKPQEGVISAGRIDLAPAALDRLVQLAIKRGDEQFRRSARRTVAFDDDRFLKLHRESTDRLLDGLADLPKRQGAVRAIAKLCHPDVSATLDAPVIGPDTLSHCNERNGVDVILVDSDRGILAGREETLMLAKRKGITLIGVSPKAVLEKAMQPSRPAPD